MGYNYYQIICSFFDVTQTNLILSNLMFFTQVSAERLLAAFQWPCGLRCRYILLYIYKILHILGTE